MLEKDWVTAIFVLIFVLLGVLKWLYNDRLLKLITIFFTKDYYLSYGKESNIILNRFNIILFTVQTLIISLFVFEYLIFFKPTSIKDRGFIVFFEIFILLLSFLFLRAIIGRLLGILFEIKKQQEHLTFSKMSYLYSSTLLIFPFLLFAFYIKTYNLFVFQLSIAVFTMLLIIRYVVIFKYNKNNVFKQLFYFILYLCALEIAPILLIYKIAVNF